MTTIECHCLHLGEPWLNAGIRTSSQPTLYVGWDVATAKSQQSMQGPYIQAQSVRQALHDLSNLDKPQYILTAGIIKCVDNYGLKANA